MSTESVHEQLAEALRVNFAAIVGDSGVTYWYTVDKAIRPVAFHQGCLDSSLTTIYCISPAEELDTLAHSTIGITSVMTLDVSVVTKFTPEEDVNPFTTDTPLRVTVQNRLIQDAKKKIRSDYKLGGLALFTTIPYTQRAAQQTYFQGWAAAFLRVQIHYRYSDTAP